MTVTKAVIPCAGMGTRFLPFTKSMPKELIPIVDKPALQIIVEEVIASGITDILIIDNEKKGAIKQHFNRDEKLENFLVSRGREDYAKVVKACGTMARFTFVAQENPKGSAHAVSLAKEFANGEPFALLFGDDVIYNGENEPATKQLIDAYSYHKDKTILGVQRVDKSQIHKYGSISIVKEVGKYFYIDNIIEKPKTEEAPSLVAALGRYILTSDVFDYIDKTPKGVGDEYQITDTFRLMANVGKVVACEYFGKRYDTGDKLGFLQCTVEYALRDSELGEKFKEYLKGLNL